LSFGKVISLELACSIIITNENEKKGQQKIWDKVELVSQHFLIVIDHSNTKMRP
jgi:hypothetical protein